MDILVRDSGNARDYRARPNEARIWGLVAAAVILGFLLLIGAFGRSERVQMASSDPVIVRTAPALIMPEVPPVP